MSNPTDGGRGISLPEDFVYGEVDPTTSAPHAAVLAEAHHVVAPPPPPLGPLAAFVGNFTGRGFNTIFRPQSPTTPTHLPVPQPGSDNILELNLTTEKLSFSKSLGSVPNRGMVQGDIFLNGVPYLQAVKDVTDPSKPVGIHVEPGIWLSVPATTEPAEGITIARMGTIPHGTTIEAQGTSFEVAGGPIIAPVNITPFITGSNPAALIPFPSQTATTLGTPRIPQDLTAFIHAGTITQPILTDPNTVLRNAILGQNITHTSVIIISTSPAAPLFGGGTANIAFLLGQQAPPPPKPNARVFLMTAIFWIETVEYTLVVPAHTPALTTLLLQPAQSNPNEVLPTFSVTPPHTHTTPRTIKVTGTQLQYTQTVFLDFNTLTWPHVSVATLVPEDPIVVPASAFA